MNLPEKSYAVSLPVLLVLLSAAGLTLYAMEESVGSPKVVRHSVDFGLIDENKDVEILDWRHGNSNLDFTMPPAYQLAAGHINQATNVIGNFPVGDALYVKRRVQLTGKVYEDTVDLRSRLPPDMTDKIIHFTVKSARLYVYLVEGNTSANVHATSTPDCPIPLYRMFRCTELYPESWKSFLNYKERKASP